MKRNNVFYDEKQDFEPAENLYSYPVDESIKLINNQKVNCVIIYNA